MESASLNRKRISTKKSSPSLVTDILSHVLAWLSYPEAAKLRRVCKEWNSLITDPKFMSSERFLWKRIRLSWQISQIRRTVRQFGGGASSSQAPPPPPRLPPFFHLTAQTLVQIFSDPKFQTIPLCSEWTTRAKDVVELFQPSPTAGGGSGAGKSTSGFDSQVSGIDVTVDPPDNARLVLGALSGHPFFPVFQRSIEKLDLSSKKHSGSGWIALSEMLCLCAVCGMKNVLVPIGDETDEIATLLTPLDSLVTLALTKKLISPIALTSLLGFLSALCCPKAGQQSAQLLEQSLIHSELKRYLYKIKNEYVAPAQLLQVRRTKVISKIERHVGESNFSNFSQESGSQSQSQSQPVLDSQENGASSEHLLVLPDPSNQKNSQIPHESEKMVLETSKRPISSNEEEEEGATTTTTPTTKKRRTSGEQSNSNSSSPEVQVVNHRNPETQQQDSTQGLKLKISSPGSGSGNSVEDPMVVEDGEEEEGEDSDFDDSRFLTNGEECQVDKEKESVLLTEQQRKIINTQWRSKSDAWKIMAYAGTGKTHALLHLVKAHRDRGDNSRFLYVVYNNAAMADAKKRFKAANCTENVEIMTTHGLALKNLLSQGIYCVEKLPSRDVGREGELTASKIKDIFDLESNGVGNVILQTLNNFFNSTESELKPHHVPTKRAEKVQTDLKENFNKFVALLLSRSSRRRIPEAPQAVTMKPHEFRERCLKDAKVLWERMKDEKNLQVRLSHDGYLKVFHLTDPDLSRDYDCVILDEAQDVTELVADLFKRQKGMRKVFVGDEFQQIYTWRGATGGLKKFDDVNPRTFYLTKSHRFGLQTAHLATQILLHQMATPKEKHAFPPVEGTPSLPTCIANVTSLKHTVIGYRHVSLVDAACEYVGKKLYFSTGKESSGNFGGLNLIYDVFRIFAGRLDEVQTSELKSLKSFSDLEQYAEENDHGSILSAIKYVKDKQMALGDGLAEIQRNKVEKPELADVIFTTVHAAKGLEWDNVRVASDFHFEETPSFHPANSDGPLTLKSKDNEHVKLLYVAVTRARKKLQIPHFLSRWYSSIKSVGSSGFFMACPQDFLDFGGKHEPVKHFAKSGTKARDCLYLEREILREGWKEDDRGTQQDGGGGGGAQQEPKQVSLTCTCGRDFVVPCPQVDPLICKVAGKFNESTSNWEDSAITLCPECVQAKTPFLFSIFSPTQLQPPLAASATSPQPASGEKKEIVTTFSWDEFL